ncbi:MAG: hypothetical protein AB8G05_11110 [Oligoflexales bacterium]
MNSFYHRNRRKSAHLTSISSFNFKWLPSSSWNNDQRLFYLDERCKDYSPFLYLPSYPNKKLEKKPELLDQWVLCDFHNTNYVWSECHLFESHFKLINIYMGSSKLTPDFLGDALSLFISSQIISQKADLLQVIPADISSQRQLEPIHKGIEAKDVWITHSNFLFGIGDCPGTKIRLWKYSPGEWWSEPKRIQDKKKLGYIEKRLNRIEKTQSLSKKKSKGISALMKVLNRRKKKTNT